MGGGKGVLVVSQPEELKAGIRQAVVPQLGRLARSRLCAAARAMNGARWRNFMVRTVRNWCMG